MSLILDALRKSDQQRARNAAERLRDGPSIARASRVPTAALLLLLFVALATAAVAVTLLLLTDRSAVGEPQIAIDRDAVKAAPVRALGTEVISRRDAQAARETPAPAAVIAPAQRLDRTHAQTAIADALAAPPLASLPMEMQERLPPLHVDIHAWADDPGARFVLINLKRYQEGDHLAEGPQVKYILRDGVVLEFEGILFSLPRR